MRYLTKRNRAILREMISSDFKVRYQGSALGYLWSLLRPLLMFAILYFVFVRIFKLNSGVPHIGVCMLFGIVLWNFFLETTIIGMSSVVSHGDLIRKISIPRYLVVVSSSASALINLLLNLLVIFAFALLDGVRPELSWLLLLPILAELFVFSSAMAFFLAALFVKFRDVTYIWEVLMQAAFYATPILFVFATVSAGKVLVPLHIQKIMLLNPMGQIIQDARHVMITPDVSTGWGLLRFRYAIIPVVLVAIITLIATIYFKKQSKFFAENI